MTTSITNQLEGAFASYGDGEVPPDYEHEGTVITNAYGFYAAIYRKPNTQEYMVAFRGTQLELSKEAIRDWSNNLNRGWPQYNEARAKLAAEIERLLIVKNASKIDLVGHSLGGALAQFAAYDVAKTYSGKYNNIVELTTWNSLGGEWGLRANTENYNPSVMNGMRATHYFRHDDFVARLGGAHIGGQTMLMMDPRYQFESISAAHSEEALRESLNTDLYRPAKPAYLRISSHSLDYAGNIAGGALNAIDGEIEGTGLIQLTTTLPTRFFHPPVIAAVKIDAAKVAGAALAHQAIAASSATGEILRHATKQIIQAIADSTEAVKAFVSGIIEAGFYYESVNLEIDEELKNARHAAIAQLIQAARDKLIELKHELANSVRWLDQLIAENREEILEHLVRSGVASTDEFDMRQHEIYSEMERYKKRFEEAERWRYVDPLILDLDNDGIETLSISEDRFFDHDNNGFAEQTAWVAPDDALLIWDRNQNGIIDSGVELFGNQTPNLDGNSALHGFQALAALDSNADGRIDARDDAWSSLAIWQDYNSNAVLEQHEMRSLQQADIQALLLQFSQGVDVDAQGNQHLQVGSFLTEDGKEQRMTDVWLRSNPARTFDLRATPISPELRNLADLWGMGNVPSLHQAMQRDSSGELRKLVEQWPGANDQQRSQLIRPLIYRWTGVFDLPANSQPFLADARSLAALEAFFGTRYRSGAGVQGWQPARQLEGLFEDVSNFISIRLDTKHLLDPLLSHVDVSWNESLGSLEWDVSRAASYLLEEGSDRSNITTMQRIRAALLAYGDVGAQILRAFNAYVRQDPNASHIKLLILEVDRQILGTSSDEPLTGSTSDDYIFGMNGDDILMGNDGNDILEGGDGDDLLIGGRGDDVYLFSRGFGRDSIKETTSDGPARNIAIFSDCNTADIDTITRYDYDLTLILKSGDQLRVANYFHANSTANAQIMHQFHFADGAHWNRTDILDRVEIGGATNANDTLVGYNDINNRMDGLAGDDQLYGGVLADSLIGNDGNDLLDGSDGDDILDGGRDDDILQGGAGNDLYRFSGNFGHDRIRDFDSTPSNSDTVIFTDILSSGVQAVECLDKQLILNFSTGNQLIIDDYFDNWSQSHRIEEFKFADGISWDFTAISHRVVITGATDSGDTLGGYLSIINRIDGLAGNDNLYGGHLADILIGNLGDDHLSAGAGDDVLQGDTGNDVLNGGSGSNTYRFAKGDGRDRIQAWYAMNPGDFSKLLLQGGIRPADVSVRREPGSTNLVLSMASSWDEIIVESFFEDNNPDNNMNPIHIIIFDDGTIWDRSFLSKQAMLGSAGHDRIEGTLHDDIIRGFAGDDQLDGAAGNDTLIGAEGNDSFWGGAGIDTLQGGSGDNRYFFTKGDGQDTIISDYSYTTTIRSTALVFANDIISSEVKFLRLGTSLVTEIQGTDDNVTIQNFFRDNNPLNSWNPVMGFYFLADQSLIRADQIPSRVSNQINGTSAANTLVGSPGIDNILGMAGNDVLDGRDGSDYLDGGDGNDTLIGGQGDDQLQGGAGIDTASYASVVSPVKVDLSITTAQDTGLSGTDTLVMIENLIGGSGDDDLKGNSGANRMDGGAGDDWIDGRAGNDNLIGGSHGPAGDTVSYASATAGVQVNLASGVASGGGGSDTINGFENIRGSAFADTLFGTTGNNILDGADGSDTVSYAGASASLRIDLSSLGPQNTGAGGIDTLLSIENLIAGSGADTLIGNAVANRLDGGAGDDILDGGSGDDVLIGGSHGSLGDTVSYASALAGVSVSLAIATAQATGGAGNDSLSGFENLTGSAYNDSLFGSDAANVLNGGAGDDLLWGSAGLDRLVGGAGADQFLYRTAAEAGNGATGRDVITDFQAEDRLDLSRIDAHASVAGDQAFLWIGAAVFSAPGQLRYTVTNGVGLLEGNLSGTGVAEFQIALTAAPSLQPALQVLL